MRRPAGAAAGAPALAGEADGVPRRRAAGAVEPRPRRLRSQCQAGWSLLAALAAMTCTLTPRLRAATSALAMSQSSKDQVAMRIVPFVVQRGAERGPRTRPRCSGC